MTGIFITYLTLVIVLALKVVHNLKTKRSLLFYLERNCGKLG